MPVMRIRYRMAEGGLMVLGPKEMTSHKALRRAKGVAGKRSRSFLLRSGSALVANEDAHSLIYWNDTVYAGVTTKFRRITGGAADIVTGLNGERLTFCAMPPTSGYPDALFVAGGGVGKLFKIHVAGVVYNWGIAPPPTTLAAALGGAGNLKGNYTYYYTFYSSATGSESNPFAIPVEITANNQQVNLTSIDVSADVQVTRRRIYRTVGNGAVPFLLTEIADNVTTVYVDNIPDTDLQSFELQFDNLSPSDSGFDFRECVTMPHLGRMWWTRDLATGHGGRIYYSPVGRAEAVQGYIEPASNDDSIQRIVVWNGSLYGFSKNRVFEVVGFEPPFSYRDITGSVGTEWPWTVVPTPKGIIYRSRDDEFLKFNGVMSESLEPGALGNLLKGQTLENFTGGFAGQYAGFGDDEYWVGDGNATTLCLFLGNANNPPSWRELGGLGLKALYTTAAGVVGVSAGGKILAFSDISLTTDGGTAIPYELEVTSVESDPVTQGVLQRVLIEHNTGNQAMTPTLILDTGNQVLANFTSNARVTTEYATSFANRLLGIRITNAGLNAAMEIFEIAVDLYIPAQERQPFQAP